METHGQVHVVTSVEDYARQLLNSATAGRLTVVDFFATWCGPCVNIAPVFAELSTKYAAGADFLKVDIEEHKELAAAAGVAALPTFLFLKSGVKVESLTGANATKLEQLIKKHLGTPYNCNYKINLRFSQQLVHLVLQMMIFSKYRKDKAILLSTIHLNTPQDKNTYLIILKNDRSGSRILPESTKRSCLDQHPYQGYDEVLGKRLRSATSYLCPVQTKRED